MEVANPICYQLFKVKKRTIQSEDNSNALLEGDIVLTLNGTIITRPSELDITSDAEVLDARVVRYCQEVNLKLQTVLVDDFETKRAVLFCGATLQPPHHAARLRVGKSPSEVYVSDITSGSPASHYDLSTATFITHVNDTEARDLDSLLKAAKTIPDNVSKSIWIRKHYRSPLMQADFTLTTISLSGIKKVIKMRKNDHYFPTKEWIRASPKWIVRSI